MNMAYDLKVLNNSKTPTTVAPTTPSTGPMDLSSGLVHLKNCIIKIYYFTLQQLSYNIYLCILLKWQYTNSMYGFEFRTKNVVNSSC